MTGQNYKSMRPKNGKLNWVVVNDIGSVINRNPTKEELKGLGKEPRKPYDTMKKNYFEGRKCDICGGNETYIYAGRPKWFNIDNKKICYNCKKDIDKNSTKDQRAKSKSPCKRYIDGDITHSEYLVELAKKKGLDIDNPKEYRDILAQERGYINRQELENEGRYDRGERLPMDINRESPQYVGIYVAENFIAKDVLSMLYKEIKKMPNNNEEYDWVCDCKDKIDVKESILIHQSIKYEYWSFSIRKNDVADSFLLIGFDNRKDLDIQFICIIKGDELIDGRKLNEMATLTISNHNIDKFIYIDQKILNEVKDKWDEFKMMYIV